MKISNLIKKSLDKYKGDIKSKVLTDFEIKGTIINGQRCKIEIEFEHSYDKRMPIEKYNEFIREVRKFETDTLKSELIGIGKRKYARGIVLIYIYRTLIKDPDMDVILLKADMMDSKPEKKEVKKIFKEEVKDGKSNISSRNIKPDTDKR